MCCVIKDGAAPFPSLYFCERLNLYYSIYDQCFQVSRVTYTTDRRLTTF